MNFYELSHPNYEDDFAAERANPVDMLDDLWLPAVTCPVCGETWAGNRRRFLPIPDQAIAARLGGSPLPAREWNLLAQAVRVACSLPDTFDLEPGDVFDMPRAELKSVIIPSFMHPFPGQVILRSEVVQALQDGEVSGVEFVPVEVSWSRQLRTSWGTPPDLYEAKITGMAWRVGIEPDQTIICVACRRTLFLQRGAIGIDEARWSGTDFFNTDRNPNLLLVTERVCQVLHAHEFTNYTCYGPYPCKSAA